MPKDYYKIMGVNKEATEKDIKAAYRRLARKYHPDISKEPQAEERFKEVGEAYETLKDPGKRAQYDQSRNQEEFFRHTQQQQSGYTGSNPFQGQFDSDLFESLFGHARRAQTQPMQGQNYQGKVTISLQEAYQGTEKSIQVPTEDGRSRTLKVKIPKGVKSGRQIRLPKQGGPGAHGGPKGDVLLTIDVMKHPFFDVMDQDIYLTLPITPWEAALGASIQVPTLGGAIALKIPANSQGGQKLRLKHRGLPGEQPGDQYVLLKIVTPPATSEEAKKLYQKMAEDLPFNPRKSLGV